MWASASRAWRIKSKSINPVYSYTLVDGRVGYAFGEGDGLELYAYGKNLFDTEYRVYSFNFADAAGFQQEFFGRPAEYGVGLITKF